MIAGAIALAPAAAAAQAAATEAAPALVPAAAAPAAAPAPPPDAGAQQAGHVALGVTVGNVVTGVTAKIGVSSRIAVQSSLGGGADGNNLRFDADVTVSPYRWRSPDGQYELPFYVGVGGALGHTFSGAGTISHGEVGVRLPVGMAADIRNNPVQMFFELAPELLIIRGDLPGGRYAVFASGAIGARYFF
jgi:hypothetical protein